MTDGLSISGGCAKAKVDAPLFETKLLSRNTDPDTSKRAAEKLVKSGELSRQENHVWQCIREFYCDYGDFDGSGFTAKELTQEYGLDYIVIQRRLSGLRNKGWIAKTGEVRNGCTVYKIVR